MKRTRIPNAVRSDGIARRSSFACLPFSKATGLGRSTVYRMVAEHTFPAPVKLAKRAVGWRHDDVRQWTIGRPSTSR